MSESRIILGVKRDEANKGEDAEDKGGIMLSIQGQQRNKTSNEYVDTAKRSNQIRR